MAKGFCSRTCRIAAASAFAAADADASFALAAHKPNPLAAKDATRKSSASGRPHARSRLRDRRRGSGAAWRVKSIAKNASSAANWKSMSKAPCTAISKMAQTTGAFPQDAARFTPMTMAATNSAAPTKPASRAICR